MMAASLALNNSRHPSFNAQFRPVSHAPSASSANSLRRGSIHGSNEFGSHPSSITSGPTDPPTMPPLRWDPQPQPSYNQLQKAAVPSSSSAGNVNHTYPAVVYRTPQLVQAPLISGLSRRGSVVPSSTSYPFEDASGQGAGATAMGRRSSMPVAAYHPYQHHQRTFSTSSTQSSNGPGGSISGGGYPSTLR